MKRYLLMCLALVIPAADLHACSIFKLQDASSILIGHSFDWSLSEAHLVINKRGVQKMALAGQLTGESPAGWTSRYGSLTLTWISQEIPTAGMNERGLLVAGLLLPETEYAATGTAPVISSSQWKQFLLDTCATVEEALEKMSQVRITTTTRFGQHFFLADATGEVVVIEFLGGVPQIYSRESLPIPVLTNTLYAAASRQAVAARQNGTGLVGESTGRFLRAAEDTRQYNSTRNTLTPDKAFAALDRVRRNDTQWQVVYDLYRKRILWRTRLNSEIQSIDIAARDYSCTTADYRPLGARPDTRFMPLESRAHRKLLNTANRQLNLRRSTFNVLKAYPESLRCVSDTD